MSEHKGVKLLNYIFDVYVFMDDNVFAGDMKCVRWGYELSIKQIYFPFPNSAIQLVYQQSDDFYCCVSKIIAY